MVIYRGDMCNIFIQRLGVEGLTESHLAEDVEDEVGDGHFQVEDLACFCEGLQFLD